MRYFIAAFGALVCVVGLSGNGPLAHSADVSPHDSAKGSCGLKSALRQAPLRARTEVHCDPSALAGALVEFGSGFVESSPIAAYRMPLAGLVQAVEFLALEDPPAAGASDKPSFEYRPVDEKELAAARADVEQKLAALEEFMSDNKEAAAGWKKYLHSDDLRAQLARGKEAKPETLNEVLRLYTSGKEGLELPEFQAVRTSLAHYTGLLNFARATDPSKYYVSRLAALRNAQLSYTKSHSTADAEALGRILAELQAADQAPEAVSRIREEFGQPNLRLRASADFVARMMNDPDKPIDETDNNFHDEIMGTDVEGVTHTTGYRTATLVPDENRAVLDLLIVGTTTSETTGYHSPVTLGSHGVTQWTGRKRLYIDADGTTAPDCSTAEACTHTCIDWICVCGGRLVTRIATRKVYQSKGEAECVAAQHAEARVKTRMESDVKEGLNKQNKNTADKFRNPLQRWGAFPEDMVYSTTSDALWVRAREAGPTRLAAPTPAPNFNDSAFLGARIHESFVNNLMFATLGGRTVTKQQFEDGMINMLGDIPEEQRAPVELDDQELKELTPDERSNYEREFDLAQREYSITFADEHPISVVFANQGYEITISATRFTAAEELPQGGKPMNITARYKFGTGPGGVLQATRAADEKGLDISPPGPPRRLSSDEVTERRVLRRRFSTMFPETMVFKGITFNTQPWRNVGALIATKVTTDGGWLAIDWRQATDEEKDSAAQARHEAWAKKNWAKVKADERIKAHGGAPKATTPPEPKKSPEPPVPAKEPAKEPAKDPAKKPTSVKK